MTIVVTGSSGLIGSEVCDFFAGRGCRVHGVDNHLRATFFGARADTRRNQVRLQEAWPDFTPHEVDIRDRAVIRRLIGELRPNAIVHAAAQPSHDYAAQIPLDDFDINAVGTLNLLEAARQSCPESPFVFLSTNKVYGDAPNRLRLVELATRWEFADAAYVHGIAENFSIDQSMHSLFGASKLAADVMVQEYGRYFGMPTGCLRGGCLTGPQHGGVELHGFLSYLTRCNQEGREYRVLGHGGKQVRDNIHARDVARFIAEFVASPRCGEVYNLGGGKGNSCSILEAVARIEALTGKPQRVVLQETPRRGDHICYYSDLRKARAHYPRWDVLITLDDILRELAASWQGRAGV